MHTILRPASNHILTTLRRSQQNPQQVHQQPQAQRNYATSLSSSIRISNIPAPHAGEITILSLNRPKARNAISQQLLGELREVVERLHADGVKSGIRAIVLASESDEAFCAGADLKERRTFSEEE
jgi:methylglutaconyl-CoA hydratase